MIIGFAGPMQAGKDTAAKYLEEAFAYEHRMFKQKMIDTVCTLFDIEPEQYENFKLYSSIGLLINLGYAKEGLHSIRRTLSGREFLERLGTEVGRKLYGEDFWVDLTLPVDTPSYKNIVVSDVRFPNEAKRISELDGYVIEIIRDTTQYDDGHPSRQRLPNRLIDYTYDNSGTIDELHVGIQRIFDRIFEKEVVYGPE